MKRLSKLVTATAAVALVQLPQLATACSVCMGDPNSNIAKGANAAIFLMLGLLAAVFALIGGFAYYLYKHSRMPVPAHVELDEVSGAQPAPGLN
jgi:hypothetical protein